MPRVKIRILLSPSPADYCRFAFHSWCSVFAIDRGRCFRSRSERGAAAGGQVGRRQAGGGGLTLNARRQFSAVAHGAGAGESEWTLSLSRIGSSLARSAAQATSSVIICFLCDTGPGVVGSCGCHDTRGGHAASRLGEFAGGVLFVAHHQHLDGRPPARRLLPQPARLVLFGAGRGRFGLLGPRPQLQTGPHQHRQPPHARFVRNHNNFQRWHHSV